MLQKMNGTAEPFHRLIIYVVSDLIALFPHLSAFGACFHRILSYYVSVLV
jgi:hypothetical protein